MTKTRWYIDVFFLILILTICTIATIPQLEAGDYRNHIIWTAELAERHTTHLPHPLYQQITLIVKSLIPFKVMNFLTNNAFQIHPDWYYKLPGLLTALISYLATALLLQHRFINYINTDNKFRQILSWVATLICLIVAPILLFTMGERLIVGYIKPNVWHNPTFSLLKPIALWIFFFVVDYWKESMNFRQWISLSIMTSLAILAKPNFILSFIPALGLLLLFYNRSLRRLPWKLLTAMMIPAFILLVYQYAIQYYSSSDQQLVIIPFKAVIAYTGNVFNLLIFYLLSILFPILVSIFYRHNIENRFAYFLVWLNFGVAVFTAILFVEQPHMGSFNLMWGQNIASFFLFTFSIGWLLKNPQKLQQKNWQTVMILLALSLHIISGIAYTLRTIFFPGPVI